MLFPRLPACAEIGWTLREKRDWEDYCPRLANHGQRLAAMGTNFYRSPQVPWE
jgi:hexosaminidase